MRNEAHIRKYWNESHLKIPKDKLASPLAIAFEQSLPRGSRVLDLGGGGGANTKFFLQRHPVTLVDISDEALSIAEERAKASFLAHKLTKLQVNYGRERLPLDDNSIDGGVYAGLSMHYFDRATTIKVIKEIKRVVAPGGRVLFTVKSPEDEKEMHYLRETTEEIESGVFKDNEGLIRSRYTKEEWAALLKDAEVGAFVLDEVIEDFSGRNDTTKSGNPRQKLYRIIFTKQ
jgi:ubiquinone/menaquinone biosynthesis C-methylase UbiE